MTRITSSEPVAEHHAATLDYDATRMLRTLRQIRWGILYTTQDSKAQIQADLILLFMLRMAIFVYGKDGEKCWYLTQWGVNELARLERE